MCTPAAIAGQSIGGCIGTVFYDAVGFVKQQAGHVINYKDRVKNLETELNTLKKTKGKLDEEVAEAKDLGKVVEVEVTEWLDKAEGVIEEVNSGFFVNSESGKESTKCCFKCSFPNFIWRYRLSKQAQDKMGSVQEFITKGKFERIAHDAPPPEELQFPSSSTATTIIMDYVSFDSRAPLFRQIVEALDDSSVNMIGIYGTGGVGKTTLVTAVGKQLKREHRSTFDEVVMAVVSQPVDVTRIQEQLAARLNPKPDLRGGVEERAIQLWNRLNNGRKNLIILDDVWNELNLDTIGIPTSKDGQNGGCKVKVVLTTRKGSVCRNMRVDKYFSVEVLKEDEAWTLFKKKVGAFVDQSDDELRSVAVAVCKECAGLPVAINAVGAALNGKNKDAWDDALFQLKNNQPTNIEGIDPRVYSGLKLSYHLLESNDARSCFLLCCLFPEDAEIPVMELARHCMARRLFNQYPDTLEMARGRVLAVVGTLKTCCLLLLNDDGNGENENWVKMHDVIRDVGISIPKDEGGAPFLVRHGVPEWPHNMDDTDLVESSSAISLSTSGSVPSDELRGVGDLVCPNLHTLMLEFGEETDDDFPDQFLDGMTVVPDEFFDGMKKRLAVLELKNVRMSPPSLAKLVDLRMLYLRHCKLERIDALGHLWKKLEILSLGGSDISRELPAEIGQLTRLRSLNLDCCYHLRVIPYGVISKLTRLEELYLPIDQCWEEEEELYPAAAAAANANEEGIRKASLGELTLLKRLTTLQVRIPTNVKLLLPKDLHFLFANLNRYRIAALGPREVEYLVGWGWEWEWTTTGQQRQLILINSSMNEELIVLLERAERIGLWKVDDGLKEVGVFYDRGGDRRLINTPTGSTSTGSFTRLTELVIVDCSTFKYLFSPSCARRISPQLKRLSVIDCEMMEQIVGIHDDDEVETNTNDHHEIIIVEEEQITAADQKLYFNRFKFMRLEGLPNLIGFYPRKRTKTTTMSEEAAAATTEGDSSINHHHQHIVPLFNEKVAFPALEELTVARLPKITAIWDQQYESLRFPNNNNNNKEEATAEVVVEYSLSSDREKKPVNNVGAASYKYNMLPKIYFQNLKKLGIHDCGKLEAIVVSEEKENVVVKEEKASATSTTTTAAAAAATATSTESDDHDIHILVFPRLVELRLDNLENLLNFYNKYRRRIRSDLGAQLAWLDHSHQVGFPELKKLRLTNSNMNPSRSRLWHGLASNLSLEELQVQEGCTEVSTAVLPHLLQRLQNVDRLVVRNSPGVREAFDLEGQYVTQGLLTTEVRWMHLDSLPQLTCFWNKHHHGILDLRNLKVVTIVHCPLLRTPFTPSIVMALEQLEALSLESCTMMEEVVIATDDHPATDVGIGFPKLRVLVLVDLPNITSFCSANYNIHLPSLGGVLLNKCPKMHTFTFGLLRMPPQIVLCTSPYGERLHIQDLNKHLEEERRRLLEGDQNKNEDNGYGSVARSFISEFGVDISDYYWFL